MTDHNKVMGICDPCSGGGYLPAPAFALKTTCGRCKGLGRVELKADKSEEVPRAYDFHVLAQVDVLQWTGENSNQIFDFLGYPHRSRHHSIPPEYFALRCHDKWLKVGDYAVRHKDGRREYMTQQELYGQINLINSDRQVNIHRGVV